MTSHRFMLTCVSLWRTTDSTVIRSDGGFIYPLHCPTLGFNVNVACVAGRWRNIARELEGPTRGGNVRGLSCLFPRTRLNNTRAIFLQRMPRMQVWMLFRCFVNLGKFYIDLFIRKLRYKLQALCSLVSWLTSTFRKDREVPEWSLVFLTELYIRLICCDVQKLSSNRKKP